ncbi:MAG: HD family phosphohydrolase [Nitrospirae bacterium GWC2_42_7]|nr:MAG: HD family phosphohydrolase [Nitrospirae bacterium GWC2_42_7]
MTNEDLIDMKKWFSDYCRSFYTSDKQDQKNISLKELHTFNVLENITLIAQEEQLSLNYILLAGATALFHDVGRFSQYAKYKTFKDSISVNHGKLGAEVLVEENVLKSLPPNEKELIVNAVKYHNVFAVPALQEPDALLLIKLIRDADKLDIYRVFGEYFETKEEDRPSAVGHGLPDLPEYSKEIISCLYEKKPATMSNLKSLNDFKLLQLSWIFDLNFRTSFRLLIEREYINKISETLPKTDEIAKALQGLKDFSAARST